MIKETLLVLEVFPKHSIPIEEAEQPRENADFVVGACGRDGGQAAPVKRRVGTNI